MASNLARIKTIAQHFGKDWEDLKVIERAITRYMDGGNWVSNGYWMVPKEYEPRLFRVVNKNQKNDQMEKLWNRSINAQKKAMNIRGYKFEHGERLYVELECDDFRSYIAPEYLSIIPQLNAKFSEIHIWQEEAGTPVLFDTDKNQSVFLIMPIKVGIWIQEHKPKNQ